MLAQLHPLARCMEKIEVEWNRDSEKILKKEISEPPRTLIPQKKPWISHNLIGNFKCGKGTNCQYTKTFFKHPVNNKIINIRDFITCKTKNEHRSFIKRNDPTSPVARHFDRKHFSALLFFIGIKAIKINLRGGNGNISRKKRETLWIFNLKSLFPKGMNEDLLITEFIRNFSRFLFFYLYIYIYIILINFVYFNAYLYSLKNVCLLLILNYFPVFQKHFH